MTSGRYGLVLREVGRLLGGGSASGLGAGPLLERFAAGRDPSAFEALVSRHGPMVLGTCRRMLADPNDVDDAFQATFLVLARKAGSIRDADRLGPWLHGVARRVSARSRALAARRRSVERPGGDEPAAESPDLLEGADLREALDDELSRLPEKYRAPLVLCYLEGLTHDEAAEHLRWPVGTVRSRLAGGRDRLRTRLTRRGLAPSAAVPAILSRTPIPQALLTTTVRLATSAGSAPAHVAALAKGALIAMAWNKLKLAAAAGLMAGLTVGGAGVAAQKGEAGKEAATADAPVEKSRPEPKRGSITIDQFKELVAERTLLMAERDVIVKKIEQTHLSRDLEIRDLENQAAKIRDQLDEAERKWKARAAGAAPAAADDLTKPLEKEIKRLTAELQSAQAANAELRKRLEARQPAPAPTESKSPFETSPPTKAADEPGGGPFPFSPAPRPVVHTLQANGAMGGPTHFAVVSAGLDRVTMIDSATKERATFKLPKGATRIVPIVGGGVISLDIQGPDVTRTAFYDSQDKRWYEYDLAEPATEVHTLSGGLMNGPIAIRVKGPNISRVAAFDWNEKRWSSQELREPAGGGVSPLVMGEIVTYRVGRFCYKYSATAKKWSILELKRELGPSDFMQSSGDGKEVITDGDAIHIYHPQAGDWTRIDTKEE